METSLTIRDRINTAADALYEESGGKTIPTVDAVRKRAKVNINDASTCMREWRRAHVAHATVPQLQLPEKLQAMSTTALQTLWTEAVNLSSETFRLAQAGWEAERADTEALSAQIANACQALEEELMAANSEITLQKQEIASIKELLATHQRRADLAEQTAAELRATTTQSEARAQEISRRADDLRQALDHAHGLHTVAASEQAALLRASASEIGELRKELKGVRKEADANVAALHTDLLRVSEEASHLRGMLDAKTAGAEESPAQTDRPTQAN